MRMFALSGLVFAVTASFVVTPAQSADVLVLVHGLGGWGEQEFLGFPYWSYRGVLEDEGLTTKVVGVGKFTSNWDRACEVYAQIKGTKVDYGVCHSREAGHLRFGNDYTGKGLYPQWDGTNRIHMMGHSMGAQTMRVLEMLLHKGSGCAEDVSPLFTGTNRNWIRSITTISGTNDGTSFVDIMGPDFSSFVADLVAGISTLSDGTFVEDIYDANMPQWGIERLPGESFKEMWTRAVNSGIASPDNKDFSMYDLSEVGARELNEQTQQTFPNTFYFSIATERTNRFKTCVLLFCKVFELPDELMIPFLWFSATTMGGSKQPEIKQKNDGLVPWFDQICPTSSTKDKTTCSEYTGTWNPEKWYYITVSTLDHLQIILPNVLTDTFNPENGPKKVYTDHARRLKALPLSAQSINEQGGLTESSANSRIAQAMSGKAGTVVYVVVGAALILIIALVARRHFQNTNGQKNELLSSNENESVQVVSDIGAKEQAKENSAGHDIGASL